MKKEKVTLRSMLVKAKDSYVTEAPCCVEESPKDHYPWGLELRLEREALEKLDIDIDDLSVGDVVGIKAMARVVGISDNERKYGDKTEKNQSLEIQIEEMGMVTANPSKKTVREALRS